MKYSQLLKKKLQEMVSLKKDELMQQDNEDLKALNLEMSKQQDRSQYYDDDILEDFDRIKMCHENQHNSQIKNQLIQDELDTSVNMKQYKKNLLIKQQKRKELDELEQIRKSSDLEKIKEIWDYLSHFAEHHVESQDLTNCTPKYSPTQQDLQNVYYGDLLKKLYGKDWKQIDSHQEIYSNNKLHTVTQFFQDDNTGEKYLLQYQVQYFQNEKIGNKTASLISKAFYQYDQNVNMFRLKNQILLDVYENFKITKNFMYNYTLNKGSQQFFFIKKRTKLNDRWFQTFELFQQKLSSNSKYDFISERRSDNGDLQTQKMDQFTIILPLDCQMRLEDIEYSFLIDATFGENNRNQVLQKNYLQKQYIIVRSIQDLQFNQKSQDEQKQVKNEILIYSLDQTSKPIIRFDQGDFEPILLGFFTKLDDQNVVFSLKGKKNQFEIEYNEYNIYKLQSKLTMNELIDQKLIKIQSIKKPFYQAFNLQLEPLHIDIKKGTINKNEKKYKQSYFISDDGDVELIYPLQSQELENKRGDDLDILSNYEIILNLIYKNHGFTLDSQIQLCTLYFDYQIEYAVRNEKMMNFLNQIAQIHQCKYMTVCCTKNTVICSNYYGLLNIYMINDNEEQGHFESYYKQKVSDKQFMLSKVLENFDWKAQQTQRKKKKLNYDYMNDKNVNNEYLDSFYINKRKKGVFSTHNKVWVGKQLFDFESYRLIIDLSQNTNENEPFYLLDLFQQGIEDVQLIKYHTTNLSVILFFLKRNKEWINDEGKKLEENENYSGVHFFMIMPIQYLKLLKLENKPILDYDSVIYIPINIDKIIQEKFQPLTILKYQDDARKVSYTHTHIDFEMVRDLGDPANQWFPFVFYDWVNQNRYNQYFCMMDVEKLGYKMHYLEQQDKDQKIEFQQHIQIFKINYFKSENEPKDLKDCNGKNIYRLNVLQQKNRNSNKFTRCSNWHKKNIQKSNHLKSVQYTTRFQIGSNVSFQSISTIEIKEFLITIDKSENYFNKDQYLFDINFQDDLAHELKQKKNSYINFIPIQQRFCIKSQQFMQNQISSLNNLTPVGNERMIPVFDDEGNVKGSYLLLNNIQNLYGTYQIILNQEKIKNLVDNNLNKILQTKIGQTIFVTKQNKDGFSGAFQDGIFVNNVNYEVTEEFLEFSKINRVNKEQQYFLFSQKRNPTFVYQMLEINDQIDKKTHSIIGELVTLRLKTFSFYNQPFNQIFLCSTNFNQQIILGKYFDKSESTYWLYHFSKILICMSQPNFEEAFNISHDNNIKRYFQPRFILNGNSLCHLDFDVFSFSISSLKEAFEFKLDQKHKYQYLENSSIYYAAISNESQCHKNIDNFVNSFQVNKFHNLQYDSMRFKSLIEQSISSNKMKAAIFMIEHMIQNCDNLFIIKALVTDLPQILCSQKIDLNKFLDVTADEDQQNAQEQALLAKDKDYNQKFNICNLEQYLIDPSLPTFGEDETNTFIIKNFSSSFWTIQEIVNFLDKEDQKHQGQPHGGGNLVNIEYTMLNFQPMIRKLKIDKILGEVANQNQHTEYRNLVKGKPQDIKYIDDLFLASLMLKNQDNPEFFLNSTIDKIIQNQFKKVRPIIKGFLYFYIFGFVLPFLITILYFNQDSQHKCKLRRYSEFSLYGVAFLTQIIFAVFEFADIRIKGLLQYISNGFNLMDASQFVFYLIHLYIRMNQKDINTNDLHLLFDKILQIIILLQSTTRILQYIRYDDDFSFLVQMIVQVLIDLMPFLTIFILYVFVFSIIIIILGGDFDNGGYIFMPKYLRIGIQIFRNAIGDIAVIDYGIWNQDEKKNQGFSTAQPIAVTLIWLIWLLYIFFMLIVMLNFIIAEVGDTYNTVKEQGQSLLNKQKLELNNLVFQIKDLFGIKNQFRALIYQQPHSSNQNNEQSIVDQINDNTSKQINKLKNQISTQIEKIQEDNKKEIMKLLNGQQKIDQKQDDQGSQIDELSQLGQDSKINNIEMKQDKLIELVSVYNERVDQLVQQDVKNMEIMMQMMNEFQQHHD